MTIDNSRDMKRIGYIFLMVLGVAGFSSCQDWLDVDPKSEIKSDLMFESESGFRDALNGVYILMRGTDLYGQEATWGFVDAIGQQYDVYSQSARYYQATRYNYNQTSSVSDALWAKSYKTIANINNILENIDKRSLLSHLPCMAFIRGKPWGCGHSCISTCCVCLAGVIWRIRRLIWSGCVFRILRSIAKGCRGN